MRSINLKTTERVDVVKPLFSYCSSNYGKDQLENVKTFIENMNAIRNDIVGIQGRNGSESAREMLKRYLAMCHLLEQRFPVGETKGMVKASLCSLQFEKACIAFNLAALNCNMGLHIDRSTADGIREAIKLFTTAAGIFSLIRDQMITGVVGGMTADLTDAALSMNVLMLLAQAQSCFYEKAVKDKLNKTLLSKLACQIAQYYNGALNYATKVRSEIGPIFLVWFRTQELSYLAAAHFQWVMAEKPGVEEKSEGFGALVARLRLARSLCSQAMQLIQQNEIRINITSLHSNIQNELEQQEKDNNMVYLEMVPDVHSLPKLQMVSSVKATQMTLQDLFEQSQTAVQTFDRLVPANVRAKLDEYAVRCQSLVDSVQELVNEQCTIVKTSLSEKGLPFAVDSEQTGLPDVLWGKIQEVQTKGGPSALAKTLKMVESMANDAAKSLDSLELDLNEERKQDEACREKFGLQWSRVPSENLNSNFWSSISNYKTKLQLAQVANEKICVKFQRSSKHHELLGQTRDGLQVTIPTTHIDSSDSPAKEKVRQTLQCLEASMVSLQSEMEELKKSALSVNISGELMQARQVGEPYDQVIEREINKFDPQKQKVMVEIERVKASIQKLSVAWNDYKALTLSTQDSRTQFLKDVEAAVSLLLEAFHETSEGVNFFSLLTEYLRTLRQQVGDWLFARREERQDCLTNMQRNLLGQVQNLSLVESSSANSFPSAPPPPPPPPSTPPAYAPP